jgi:4-hydroxyacetophenone monooxygenase
MLGPGDNDSGGFPAELQAMIRAEAVELIGALQAGRLQAAPHPSPERVAEMLEISLGERLPEGCGPLLAEELGILDRHVEIPDPPSGGEFHVLVIGAGVSGLLAAIELRRGRHTDPPVLAVVCARSGLVALLRPARPHVHVPRADRRRL